MTIRTNEQRAAEHTEEFKRELEDIRNIIGRM